MVDFKSLKNATANADRLKKAAEQLKNKYESEDARFWQPTFDKTENAFAVIRFLPAPQVDGDDGVPYITYYRHSFKAPTSGEWFIENCPSTLERKSPANEVTRVLWKIKDKDAADPHDVVLRQLYGRKQTFVSNIMVVEDPLVPANNGQLRLWRYGQKVYTKLNDAMFPKHGKSLDLWDFWKGANFIVDLKKVGGFNNYDSCRLDVPSVLNPKNLPEGPELDAWLEELWKSQYSLLDFKDPKHYKSYEELKARFDAIVGYTIEDRGTAWSSRFGGDTVVAPVQSAPPKFVADQQKASVPKVDKPDLTEALGGDSLVLEDDPATESKDPLKFFEDLIAEQNK